MSFILELDQHASVNLGVSIQLSAVSRQPSAVSRQPSAVSLFYSKAHQVAMQRGLGEAVRSWGFPP
ncbi:MULTISPECIES: hypothetical protein [Moorena]|uniref:hypothetical protein n=1 Tax=Moorena TaxID=1155738 RepID=UPI0002E5FE89|nr:MULTISPECIES: hypothetical protein [Moorena]NEP32241.1 hypothetical protein [Moorena sp. SIO3B2]NEP66190.1 hypothetical protein [Moorena sp. SIO3A5]NEQ07724.1 hypothetical protein [Moorena sp. SIO4E2]NER89304.1 hypothetical protein [Moorena sp. SIO3A2]NES42342.1 hypothetical protein [Moorena sp. SIO2C4]